MRRWIKIVGAILLGLWLVPASFGLLCMISLPKHDYWVRMQFPRGFRGPALIAFDEPSGKPLRWEGETLHLDFPRSGVIKLRDSMDAFPDSWQTANVWDDGTPMPDLMDEGSDKVDPRIENFVSVFGGDNLDNKFMHFFVGSIHDMRSDKSPGRDLEEQYEIDVKRVQRAGP